MILFAIKQGLMDEFKKKGLDVKYSEEIGEWLKYKDEEEYKVKSEKQMRDEIERFTSTIEKWSPKEKESTCPDI